MSLTMVEIAEEVRTGMARHARAEYPEECCGVLVGTVRAGVVRVVRGVAAKNVAEAGRLRDRYAVEPLAIVRTERAARAEGMEVVGVYHSHPDHAARASNTDAHLAWEGYVYVIVSVDERAVREMRAWEKGAEGALMREIEVVWG